nr:hypothetical protein [Sphingopyxis sp. P8]
MARRAAGKEAVDIAFLDAIAFRIEFALDRAKAVLAANLGDQIDPDILAVEPLRLRPIGEGPNVLIFLGHARIIFDKRQRQPLEICSLFALGLCRQAILGKKLAKRCIHLKLPPEDSGCLTAKHGSAKIFLRVTKRSKFSCLKRSRARGRETVLAVSIEIRPGVRFERPREYTSPLPPDDGACPTRLWAGANDRRF